MKLTGHPSQVQVLPHPQAPDEEHPQPDILLIGLGGWLVLEKVVCIGSCVCGFFFPSIALEKKENSWRGEESLLSPLEPPLQQGEAGHIQSII